MAEADVVEKTKNFIMQRSGLYFKEYQMPSLQETIAKRMAAIKCPTRWEYYNLLTSSPQAHREFTELLNLLTIKHTHFFRNTGQFIALRDKVVPEVMEKKAKTSEMTLNILSAGCSTGQEPYSIAMILLDLLERNPGWKVGILATDISTEALVAAKSGIYPVSGLQYIEKDFITRYMERFCLIHKDKVFVSPAVKNLVDFQYLNLIDEFYPAGFDIIFCRNVTIYFETETVKSVIEKFYKSLNDGGYFFAGGTETLYGISDKFKLAEIEHTLVYKKIPGAELKPPEEKIQIWQPANICPQEPVPEATEAKRTEPARSLKDAHQFYEKAKKDFLKKDYPQAEKSAQSALEIEPCLQEARILLADIFVNQERFEEAERECRKCININFLTAEPHYLLGLIYKKKSRYKEAEGSLKKAIYLNTNFSLAYFALADLYREKGKREQALKAYENTLRVLEEEPEEHFRETSAGLSKKVLAQVCVSKTKELSGVR